MANHTTREEWEKIRAKGRVRHTLSFGILKVGIIAGGLFSVLACEIGAITHKYVIPLPLMALIFFALVCLFTIGFGCLAWYLNEKSFQMPVVDNQSFTNKIFTKDEFNAFNRKIARRDQYRRLLGLPFLVLFGVGLSLVPRSGPHHGLHILLVAIAGLIFFISLVVFVARGIKADTYKFGAMCPQCGKPLYDWNGMHVRDGCCARCGGRVH